MGAERTQRPPLLPPKGANEQDRKASGGAATGDQSVHPKPTRRPTRRVGPNRDSHGTASPRVLQHACQRSGRILQRTTRQHLRQFITHDNRMTQHAGRIFNARARRSRVATPQARLMVVSASCHPTCQSSEGGKIATTT